MYTVTITKELADAMEMATDFAENITIEVDEYFQDWFSNLTDQWAAEHKSEISDRHFHLCEMKKFLFLMKPVYEQIREQEDKRRK